MNDDEHFNFSATKVKNGVEADATSDYLSDSDAGTDSGEDEKDFVSATTPSLTTKKKKKSSKADADKPDFFDNINI